MSEFFNPHGKIYEIDDFCPWCMILAGIAVIVAAVFLPSLAQDHQIPFAWTNLHLIASENAAYVFAKAKELDLFSLFCLLVLALGIFLFWDNFADRKKNTKYIIDARNNLFLSHGKMSRTAIFLILTLSISAKSRERKGGLTKKTERQNTAR